MRVKLFKPDEVEETIKSEPGLFVVDVRGDELFNKMRLPYKNVVNVPFAYLDERMGEIPKDRKIIVACHAGKQALTAGPYLKGKGYDVIGCIEGGMMAWQKVGKPVQN